MRPIPRRGIAIALLLALLGGLCVQYGALTPAPESHRYPGNGHVASGDVAPGDRVVLAGTVRSVDGERAIIELDDGPPIVVRELRDGAVGDATPTPGDDVWFAGVVRPDGSVTVERALVRAPWEITYLYSVSALGALLLLVRFVRTWRFDTDHVRFVPREGKGG
ncbi:hypothetical protein [Haloplanus halobius]|uniref:hypothetical protein n=1 Tax=Haloplanus halobius TaxID=2934938 RepID=UPI00200BF0FD|nr:hypothetical protein [Haloplanus sp. XH21]